MLYEKEGLADEDGPGTRGWTTNGDAGELELTACIGSNSIRDKYYKTHLEVWQTK